METIKCAAIKRSDIIIAGRNHAFCITYSPDGTCKDNSQQGFITSTARFVNRADAAQIAAAAGQIAKPTDFLYSEDITGDTPWAGEIIEKLEAQLERLRNHYEVHPKENDHGICLRMAFRRGDENS